MDARTLVIDDEQDVCDLVSMCLTSDGAKVIATTSVADALNIVEREDLDVVLTDLGMAEMDGLEATARIRQHWPSDRLPIIAMTAHAYEADRQRCLDVGMNDHIAKPVDPALLMRTPQG